MHDLHEYMVVRYGFDSRLENIIYIILYISVVKIGVCITGGFTDEDALIEAIDPGFDFTLRDPEKHELKSQILNSYHHCLKGTIEYFRSKCSKKGWRPRKGTERQQAPQPEQQQAPQSAHEQYQAPQPSWGHPYTATYDDWWCPPYPATYKDWGFPHDAWGYPYSGAYDRYANAMFETLGRWRAPPGLEFGAAGAASSSSAGVPHHPPHVRLAETDEILVIPAENTGGRLATWQ